MNEFISEKDYWSILRTGILNSNAREEQVDKLIALLMQGRGNVGIVDTHLIFVPFLDYYDVTNYVSYSSSVIKKHDGTGPDRNQVMDVISAVDEELMILKDIVYRVNEAFEHLDTQWREIFLNRVILNEKYYDATKRYNISKRKYYDIIEASYRAVAHSFCMKRLLNKSYAEAVEYLNKKYLSTLFEKK